MASEREFQLRILSPEDILYDGQATFVSAPGFEGELGILAGHAPLLARLSMGEILIRGPEGEATLVIGGGFLEVHHDSVTLLVEDAVASTSLDLKTAEERLAEVEARARTVSEPLLRAKMDAELKRAVLELRLAKRRLG